MSRLCLDLGSKTPLYLTNSNDFFSLRMQSLRYIFLVIITLLAANARPQSASPSDFVNPFVGTDFNGHTFPGATTPFGMVQLSPDTRIDGSWEGCSGYHYSDTLIYGFSHTHLSGTGVSDYGDILIMPILNDDSFEAEEYAATFKHENETASAGYYQVGFDNGIQSELTATTRCGFHRYRYPTSSFSVIIDLNHRDHLVDGKIEVIDDHTIQIKRISSAWAKNQHAYAHIEFSQAFAHRFNEDKSKIILSFEGGDKELLIRAGMSFVSQLGAKTNLKAELNHWNFEHTKHEAKASWDNALSKIIVEDDDMEKLRVFYTALYHVMIHPNVAMDVNGNYRGMDNIIHKAEGFTYYTVFSLWDTFRATHPLFTITEQKRSLDFIKSFLAMYEQGGRLPVWELCSNETDCMIGYHSVSVIADALAKGIDDFDIDLAYQSMTASANWDHLGLPAYINQGFLSIDDEHESVSKTLEYAYDDWCIAQVALRLNKTEDYKQYILRSNAWRNLLDPESKLMRPRKNGGWLTPFEPREVNNHFTEGNAWQYSFFVPHDVKGLIKAMGGVAPFEAQLDVLFSAPIETTGRTQPDISGLIGQYAHGNEPSHHMAYLYNYIGKPDKTNVRVHQILSEFYTSKPDGLIGNEDCGQMSAWFVMSSLGIYAVTPGKAEYALCDPYFEDYTVRLENGNSFSKATILNALKSGLFIDHDQLMGQKKEESTKAPDEEIVYMLPPIISAPSVSFDDRLSVTISIPEGHRLLFDVSTEKGTTSGDENDLPLVLEATSQITAYSIGPTDLKSKPVSAKFYKNPHPNWEVSLQSVYNPQYSAGGANGLIDGIFGDENWRKGYWQGYQDQDFEAIIDLSQSTSIRSMKASFLQDTRSWIIFPIQVAFYTSQDGVDFEEVGIVIHRFPAESYDVALKTFEPLIKSPLAARYIKVKAVNFGKLPIWHQGAGGEAFIFIDEISIE